MSVSYIPEPAERPYYQGLFQAADTTGSGTLSGAEAVNFFMRSKLPMEVLKNIWTVADQPSTNSLDLKKFAVAVRLIQLTQNGQKGQGTTLAVAEGVTLRPVMFEGVSGVSVPMPSAGPSAQSPPPPQQHQQQQQQPQAPQAPPTPTQVRSPPRQQPQGTMQAPPSPARSVASSVNMPAITPGGSRALVSQDPYFMTPSERARFDDLFPTYAKPDGYIYGKEAVELFMKSGVDQAVLRDIWSMVDRPVDNRLDRLEFALAMHLIVCISKKNLPAPRGALPNSLKALKAANSTGAPPTPMTNPPVAQMGQTGLMPPPDAASSTGPPKIAQPQMSMAPPSASFEQGPPPIVQTGGMNISDAFEGLSVTSNDVHAPTPAPAMPSSLPSYVPEETTMSFAPTGQDPTPEPEAAPTMAPAPTPMAPPTPARMPEPVASAPPQSSQALASKYDMGDAHQELGKLKAVMQKLQAENISLKAQLGTLSDEEKDVQKELSAVVTEIGKLSTELQSLRAQVSTAKSKLLEASAELKAAQERKTVLTDLIGEANETKAAIENASAAIANASVPPQPVAPPAVNHFEGNLFGFDDAPVSAPAPVSMEPSMANMYSQPPQPAAQPAPAPMVQTVDSDDEDEKQTSPTADADATELFNNEYNPPAPAPAPEQPAAPPAAQHQQPPPQPMYGAPPPQQQYQYQQPPPPAAQVPSAHPTPSAERPVAGKHRPNQPSMGFNSDFIMGGAADPLPQTSENGMARASRAASSGSDFGYDDEESFKKVEELKKKAESAAAAARDAEAAHSKLLNEAEELRVDADKQEATARSLKAAAGEKKKSGRFGRGGGDKKKIMREAERAAEDAQDIRKRFLVIQGQAKDASAIAIQTRKEAEKLRKEAEQAEIDMVSAASLRDQQKADQQGPPPQQPGGMGYGAPPQAPYGGYGAPPQGYGQPPQYGQPPASDHGFNAGAMGGGGNYGFAPPSQYGQQPAYGNPSPW
eukprot:Nitzschia sp. Nitz4//scaffold88_size82704//79177//82405//NITZ4_005308-RA/size82704-augustus-gene-0.81-mRNA-1//1//CDS//3329559542//652//frame0